MISSSCGSAMMGAGAAVGRSLRSIGSGASSRTSVDFAAMLVANSRIRPSMIALLDEIGGDVGHFLSRLVEFCPYGAVRLFQAAEFAIDAPAFDTLDGEGVKLRDESEGEYRGKRRRDRIPKKNLAEFQPE